MIKSYLDAVALAYLAAPTDSDELDNLHDALALACDRHGVDIDHHLAAVRARFPETIDAIDESEESP